MRTDSDIEHLLLRHLQGFATEEENHRIKAWAAEASENRVVLERMETEGLLKEDLGNLFDLVDSATGEARLMRMKTYIQRSIVKRPARKFRKWVPYAAAVVLALAIGIFFLDSGLTNKRQMERSELPMSASASGDIVPGGNRATLTLADGRTIRLDESQAGIIIDEHDISYHDGASLALPPSETLVLTTPKGGTYQVTLPDGTKVWLNAASTLKYPSRFDSDKRVVYLEGEAYFDVAKVGNQTNKTTKTQTWPFQVVSVGQRVEVLGTEFNVSTYAEEAEIKTTLIEGSIRVLNEASGSVNQLAPGEQSVVQASATQIQQVNIERYTAWKNGYFFFKQTPFEDVMRQLARWYDVEVIYQGTIPQETFSGEMDRDLTLNAALKLLNVSAVQVQITAGNQLIVH